MCLVGGFLLIVHVVPGFKTAHLAGQVVVPDIGLGVQTTL